MARVNIDKAIKKQKSRLRLIIITMILLSIILPLAVFLSGETKFDYIIILCFIEFLIVITIIAEINRHTLRYTFRNNKLKIVQGLFGDHNVILCNAVKIVHVYDNQGDINIIIITNRKIRNKFMKPVTPKFLNRYNEVYEKYKSIKKFTTDEKYYRTIIKAGGVKKYILLKDIYSVCVKALYTDSAIESIKVARGYKEIDF